MTGTRPASTRSTAIAIAIPRLLLPAALAACAVHEPPPPAAPLDGIDEAGGDDDSEREPPIAGAEGDDDRPIEPGAETRGPDRATGGGDALLAEARRELAAVRTSTYAHHTRVDEAHGRFDYDCSGFVEYALARSSPGALRSLVAATVRRPLAKHVVAFLRGGGGPGWRPVARAIDLGPGDVIAWLEPADMVSRNTGHVLIVRGPVRAERGGVRVPIIDSTSVRHGRTDSRTPARATGLGTGEILLLVDDAGAPVGYRWSFARRVHPHATTIGLGRLTL